VKKRVRFPLPAQNCKQFWVRVKWANCLAHVGKRRAKRCLASIWRARPRAAACDRAGGNQREL
jgi:hypothetical protein